jgi:hypothetical protein
MPEDDERIGLGAGVERDIEAFVGGVAEFRQVHEIKRIVLEK